MVTVPLETEAASGQSTEQTGEEKPVSQLSTLSDTITGSGRIKRLKPTINWSY